MARLDRRRTTASGRPAAAVTTAAVAVVAAGLVWWFFVLTPEGQRLDAAAYGGASWLQIGPWELVDSARAAMVLPAAALVVVVAVGWLVTRRLWWPAATTSIAVIGSLVSIQLLKTEVLPRPDLGFPPAENSLPSGHAGAVVAACAALALAAPARARPVILMCAPWAVAGVGAASVVGFQHRPSDIVAAVLVVLAWAAAAAAAYRPRAGAGSDERPWRAVPSAGESSSVHDVARALGAQALVVAVPAAATLALALVLPDRRVGGLETLVALGGGLAAILAVSSLAFAVLALLAPLPDGPSLRTRDAASSRDLVRGRPEQG